MRIRIEEARMAYQIRTGKAMSNKLLAEIVLPDVEPAKRELNLRRLSKGQVKRIEIGLVRRICAATGVDANFLFGIKIK